MSYTIQHLPCEERPRERLARFGADSMSIVELLAIILGSGTKETPVLHLAQKVIAQFGTLQKLSEATINELCEVKGIGPAKAIQLKAALTLGTRASKQDVSLKYPIENPRHAYNLIKQGLEHETRELFLIVLLDVKNCHISTEIVSIGSLSKTIVHPREVFYPAIRHKAASVLLAHNHPSGDPSPSPQDLELTETLVKTGELLGIPVHDHIIVGKSKYISLREKGISFN